MKPDEKHIVVLESGARIHETAFSREKPNTQCQFTTKLRKYLKGKRLEHVRQVGFDRVVDFVFGTGQVCFHLIVELYSSGNIVLCNHDFVILALLRQVDLTAVVIPLDTKTTTNSSSDKKIAVDQVKNAVINVRVGEKYVFLESKPLLKVTKQAIENSLHESIAKLTKVDSPPEAPQDLNSNNLVELENVISDPIRNPKKPKKKYKEKKLAKQSASPKDLALRKWAKENFSSSYGPSLVDHALYLKGTELSALKLSDIHTNSDLFAKVVDDIYEGFTSSYELFVQIHSGEPGKGFISYSVQDGTEIYDEFHPFLYSHLQHTTVVKEFSTFSESVDEFYTRIETQKIHQKSVQAQQAASKRLETVQKNHATQIKTLENTYKQSEQFAKVIEYNQNSLDMLLVAIKKLVDSGLDWVEIWNIISDEKRNGNSLLECVHSLKLEKGLIVVQLMDPEEESVSSEDGNEDQLFEKDESEDSRSLLLIELDINCNAYSNARNYYDSRRVAATKVEKTVVATTKALKATTKKIEKELQKTALSAPQITTIRKTFWFEKFIWFISSENFLVVGARDSAQAQLLLTRYMKPSDVYVGSDIEGSMHAVIFRTGLDSVVGVSEELPVPPVTLHQAGTLSVVHSRAWDSKIVTSAFWVRANSIYWENGVIVKGVKNFLPPVYLIFGFGILFLGDGDFKARHFNDRRPWLRIANEATDLDLTPESENVENRISVNSSVDSPDIESVNFDKYSLPTVAREPTLEIHEIEEITPAITKKRISAKERNGLLKHEPDSKSNTEDGSELESRDIEKSTKDSSEISFMTSKASKIVPRGKKGKLKKMKDKYQDQDEEDRQVMMQLLQGPSKPGKEVVIEKPVVKQKQKQTPKPIDFSTLEKIDLDFSMIDYLTGQPTLEDNLQSAIAVCAPWTCLSKYKYKVKLIPGSLKKGKAVNTVSSLLSIASTDFPTENTLISQIPETEMMATMLSKVKITSNEGKKKTKNFTSTCSSLIAMYSRSRDETPSEIYIEDEIASCSLEDSLKVPPKLPPRPAKQNSEPKIREEVLENFNKARKTRAPVLLTETSKRCSKMTSVYFYDYYVDLLVYVQTRKQRTNDLLASFQNHEMTQAKIKQEWARFCKQETENLRARRTRIKITSFQIITQIGQGGYGRVFLARKRGSSEILALKQMDKFKISKLNETKHIMTERDILTRTNSAWLVKLFYAFQDSVSLYLAMEYVSGGDFRTLLNNSGVLRDDHAKFYIAEMALAMSELHKLGFIHRDLKPENFLIDVQGHIKLTDFGLCRGSLSEELLEVLKLKLEMIKDSKYMYRSISERGSLYKSVRKSEDMRAFSQVGSPDYMAPEVLHIHTKQKTKSYDLAVDYWSLGCILFECLAGFPPFTAETNDAIWINVYHWKKVLERPVYSGDDEEFNLTDVAWDLITKLLTGAENRICGLGKIQAHPYFNMYPFTALRTHGGPKPPFVPHISSPVDTSYFDDFTNPSNMSMYKEVREREENWNAKYNPPKSGNLANLFFKKRPKAPENPDVRKEFVGFTFKHKEARSFGGVPAPSA